MRLLLRRDPHAFPFEFFRRCVTVVVEAGETPVSGSYDWGGS
jgi:hypothetical protein